MIPWKEIELDRPETSAPCLVCGQEAGALFHLSRTLLRHAFSNRGQIPPPPEALQEDYTMFRCGQCG
jgi:ribosomal protein S14